MKAGLLSLVACLGCWMATAVVAPGGALAEGALPAEAGGGASLSLGGALVTPGSPTEAEQREAQEQTKLANPGAVIEREASRTEYEGLNAEHAATVASELFPVLLDESAGRPSLPAGASVGGYLTSRAASVDLGGGRPGVLESLQPMAIETSSGRLAAINLSLSSDGSAFEPATPAVAVSIPKHLSGGVSMPALGVSLTPTNSAGAALSGSARSMGLR